MVIPLSVDRSLADSVAGDQSASQGKQSVYWRYEIKVDPRAVPPHGEGLDKCEESRPYQEPGWCTKTSDAEVHRREVTPRARHDCMPIHRGDIPTILAEETPTLIQLRPGRPKRYRSGAGQEPHDMAV